LGEIGNTYVPNFAHSCSSRKKRPELCKNVTRTISSEPRKRGNLVMKCLM
jgi:hypothetical protein